MGQYYKPALIQDFGNKVKNWVLSHDIGGNGLKLMEHSWIGNTFVSTIEGLLVPGGDWHKKSIVWAGDYADKEPDTEKNIYELCIERKKIKPKLFNSEQHRYILNHTTKQFVDKLKVPDSDGWRIHPLPLLTCEGNNRGGGDYRGENDIIGSWARNKISVEIYVPEEFTELVFDLVE